jgi:hypothetical protein
MRGGGETYSPQDWRAGGDSLRKQSRGEYNAPRNSQFAIRNSQFAIRNSQFAIRNSQFAIRNSQFAIPTSYIFLTGSERLRYNRRYG